MYNFFKDVIIRNKGSMEAKLKIYDPKLIENIRDLALVCDENEDLRKK